MDQRTVNDSFNNSDLKGNNAIQADNATQSQLINNADFDKAFQELLTYIKKLENDLQREQAQHNAEQMKEALESGDKSTAEKIWKFLQGSLGNLSSLATIAQLFGLSVPLG